MILFQRHGLRYVEFHFDEPEVEVKADIARYMQRSRPVPNARSTSFWTPVIDLRLPTEELLARTSKNMRYVLRKSSQYNFRHSVISTPDRAAIDTFIHLQNTFARRMNLAPVDEFYCQVLAQAGLLEFSWVTSDTGTPFAWRSYLKSGLRARVFQGGRADSISTDEQGPASRANAWGLWQDLLHYHRAGLTYFDLGGWYSGTTDVKLLRVNDFKGRFGGVLAEEFKCVRALSIRGKIALAASGAVQRLRDYSARRYERPEALIGDVCG